MATSKEIEISAKLYEFLEKEGMEILRSPTRFYISNKETTSGYVYLTLGDVLDIVERNKEE